MDDVKIKTTIEENAVTAMKTSSSEKTFASSNKIQPGSLSALGDAFGVALLLGNHSKFGLAERCCYHFDLIETLTSLPTESAQHAKQRGRDRGDSVSSYEEGINSNPASARLKENAPQKQASTTTSEQSPRESALSSTVTPKSCYCGVVALLECVPCNAGDSRVSKRLLRSRWREFNARAQKVWRRGGNAAKKQIKSSNDNMSEGHVGLSGRHCHQPRHLPLPLNPSTRVTFAYELTSIAVVVDASPSATAAVFLNGSCELNDGCCVPLDRLGPLLTAYFKGLVQPIAVPPVLVTGMGVAFGRWTPNLAVTVVAAYPPSQGRLGSASLLVRDFRVVDEQSAVELGRQVDKWALHDVEGVIADRLGGGHFGNDLGGRSSQGSGLSMSNAIMNSQEVGTWASVRSCMKDLLEVGDAALATLPKEGRPVILIASDCLNVHCGGVFDHLAETARSDVPINVINLSILGDAGSISTFPLDVSDDSKMICDAARQSGGILLNALSLESYTGTIAGSSAQESVPFQGDAHFMSKKRSIRPNALQYYTLFSLSPLTPSCSSHYPTRSVNLVNSAHNPRQDQIFDSVSTFSGKKYSSQQSFDIGTDSTFSTQAALNERRIFFVKYNINPVRIKSLLMSRILEGYQARRYGHNTQDSDKVSVHMMLKLYECNVTLHYEVSFVASPYHVATIGTAHIKLELSAEDLEFIALCKKKFISQQGHDSVVSTMSIKAANKVCKLLRWIRKEDYLESFFCLPGWGEADHFAREHSFLRRLQTLTVLQRHRHFRCETFEVIAIQCSQNNQNRDYALFSDVMQTDEGEDNLYEAISSWATGMIENRTTYFKTLPPKTDDITYYLVIHVKRCHEASRVHIMTMDFHGELTANERLSVVASFQDQLCSYKNLVILEKPISGLITIRPKSKHSSWAPKISEYFLHHKNWSIVKDQEVLPLITKRRTTHGFTIIHSEVNRVLFAKFVYNDACIYQVLNRSDDDIIVDIHMESNRALFDPFHARESAFCAIYEKVKTKDMECARNLHARTNLLRALDDSEQYKSSQAEDLARLIKISSRTNRHLRFFKKGDSSANHFLHKCTSDFMTSGALGSQSQIAQLSVNQTSVGDLSGCWFVMRSDWYVLSLIHFSDLLIDEDKVAYHDLTLFTAGINSLYPNDITKDVIGGEDDPYGLDLFLHQIEREHGKNYAIALYQSLIATDSPVDVAGSEEDIAFALSYCSFKTVLKVLISLDDLTDELHSEVETMTGIKLYNLIKSLLRPLPESNGEVFYFIGDTVDDAVSTEVNTELTDLGSLHSNDLSDSLVSKTFVEEESDVDYDSGNQTPHQPAREYLTRGPLYFKLFLNGKIIASQKDVCAVKQSTSLEAQISVFDSEKNLPPMHLAAILKLRRALTSFTVDQRLEKYRFMGDSLSKDDLRNIAEILPQTNHLSIDVSLSFYDAKANAIVTASDHDLDHAYSILFAQLNEFCALRASTTSFLALNDSNICVIPYWCFIQVVKSLGIIVIKACHPSGDVSAREVMERARAMVVSICHRTNQLLLLEDLYKTRSASSLLVPDDPIDIVDEEDTEIVSTMGIFSCPIQYREILDLNSRCTPNQAIETLMSSTLHNFLVSNRRRMFIYKDEDHNVFYMDLIEHSNAIELIVRGLCTPGPSITEQLVCLLQKNMLVLPLNALSAVLTKNPFFALLPTDLTFLRGFGEKMANFDGDYDRSSAKSRRIYGVPSRIADPLGMLLLFRRNITGSTFIHHLQESIDDNTFSAVSDVLSNESDVMIVSIPPREFTFYFNSSPVTMKSTMSTLTERGKQFSREASGIAIIEICLLHCRSRNTITVSDKRSSSEYSTISKSDILLKRMEEDELSSSFQIVVDITNTTVDIDVLHRWVELSLNQSLLTWDIETQIQITHQASQKSLEANQKESSHTNITPLKSYYKLMLSQIVPNLPAFEETIQIAIQLPHPVCDMVKNNNMIRGNSLATLTLNALEMILSIVCQKAKVTSLTGVKIIRCTNKVSIVNITRDPMCKESVQVESETGKRIKDRPIESPEYISVFGLGSFDQTPIVNSSHLFFKEIFDVQQSHDTAFTEAMAIIKMKHPSLFKRQLAFILRVSRSCRTLLAYNMHPQLLTNIKQKFSEIDNDISKRDATYRTKLLTKCECASERDRSSHVYKTIKPNLPKPATPTTLDSTKQEKVSIPTEGSHNTNIRGPKRRIPRPTSMLRPKLIGKSVEGSALEAVKASRLRARSSRPLPPQRSVPGSGKLPSNNAQNKETERSKTKKTSLTVTKDAGRTSISRLLPVASQTKLINDLSALFKTPNSLSPKFNQLSIQTALQTLPLFARKDSGQMQLTHVFANCFGNYLGSHSVELFICDHDDALISSFLCQVTKKLGHKSWISDNAFMNPIFVAREVVSIAIYQATVLFRLSLTCTRKRTYVFNCRAWLVIGQNTVHDSKDMHGYVRQCDQKAAIIEALADDFMNNLNLESEVLDFVGCRLADIARGRIQNYQQSTVSLLRTAVKFQDSLRYRPIDYHMQRRFLSPSSFLSDLPDDAYQKSILYTFLLDRCKSYHLLECGGTNCIPCFVGNLKVVDYIVHYFITWHESIEHAFEIFVLVETKGRRLDLYIGKAGSPYAEQVSRVILYATMCTVQDTLRRAALDLRKQHLWRVFGKNYESSMEGNPFLENDALEMIRTSYKIEMDTIDNRVQSFFNESDNLQISWDELFFQMQQSYPFNHCITFNSYGCTHYVLYVKCQDLFLSFKQQNQRFEEIYILVADIESPLTGIVEHFINQVTRWLFISSCNFNAT